MKRNKQMIKLFTLFIAFNLSNLNFVQAESVGVSYIQTSEVSQAIQTYETKKEIPEFLLIETTRKETPEVSPPIQTIRKEVKASVWNIHTNFSRATGFFIKPNLFVTNFHVIDVLLKTDKLENIRLSQKGNPNTLHIKKVIALSALYDLALLESKESSPHYLTLSENEVKINDELFSISYPLGVFTKISKTGNINYEDSQRFSFPANHSKIDGASGSPLLNKQKQVVGVLFKSSKNMAYAIKVNHLKNLIAGNTGESCKNKSFKNCLEKEIENLKSLAEQGNPIAQNELAWIYRNSEGVEKNPELAFYWTKQSAEQGLAEAQNNLAWMYENGEGVEQNSELAFKWYLKAAEQGLANAQHSLALMYLNGDGVEQNSELAFKWYLKAAEQGLATAQYNLAWMYLHGEGVEQNSELAFYWLEQAAEQGLAEAQYNLAWMYLHGEGVEQNSELAFYWLEQAAEQDHTKAQGILIEAYLRGDETERNLLEAFKWFWRAL